MTGDNNLRMKIHICTSCEKMYRGREWKRHKKHTNHTASWRRFFCSSPTHKTYKHALETDTDFLNKHLTCQKQQPISNPTFRAYIQDLHERTSKTSNEKSQQATGEQATGEQQPTGKPQANEETSSSEDSDSGSEMDSESESESECEGEGEATTLKSSQPQAKQHQAEAQAAETESAVAAILQVNTDGEEEEGASIIGEEGSLIISEPADSEREAFVRRIEEERKQAEKRAEEQKAKEGSETASGEAASGEAASSEAPVSETDTAKAKQQKRRATTAKAGPSGVKKQARNWDKDAKAQTVNRAKFLEGIYVKYNVLTRTHNALVESFDTLQSKQLQAKAAHEEAEMAKAAKRCTEKELAATQAKLVTSDTRLALALEEIATLKRANCEMQQRMGEQRKFYEEREHQMREQELERRTEDFQAFEIHVPTDCGRISDRVLIYNTLEDPDRDCYQSIGKSCLHLNLVKTGKKIKLAGYNYGNGKRLSTTPIQSEAQRPRHQ